MNFENMTILIVDDIIENIQVAMEALKPLGCKFLYAKNGMEGLKRIKQNLPDLILLDIMMPQMDGFETCKELKKDEETKDIPIIFLSAFSATQDILKGFDLGAVDYVSKPFQTSELTARVKTHLTLRGYEKQLKTDFDKSEQKVKTQEEMLLSQSKLASIGQMINGLSYHWNQPLSIITASASGLELQNSIDKLDKSSLQKNLRNIISSADYISKSIQDFKNFYNNKSIKQYFKIEEAFQKAIKLSMTNINQTNIILKDSPYEIKSLETEVIQVLINILTFISKILHHDNDKTIIIDTTKENNTLNIIFKNESCGFSLNELENIFAENTEASNVNLYLTKLIVEKLGGELIIQRDSENTVDCNYLVLKLHQTII